MKDSDQFYYKKEGPVGDCLVALRSLILQYHERITETVKYGMPCFCVGKKPLCYLWTDKDIGQPYILFVDGNQMEHSALEQGKRAKMKVFYVHPHEDLPVELIQTLLDMAIEIKKS
ncbi:MAG: DUF1801 domain-containing protein [Bacteroidota bacterium]